MSKFDKSALGWLPDYPDFRDYTQEQEEINKVLAAHRRPEGQGETARLGRFKAVVLIH